MKLSILKKLMPIEFLFLLTLRACYFPIIKKAKRRRKLHKIK